MKVKRESEVTQLCPTLSDPMDCSPPGSSLHGIFQARVLEWSAIASSTLSLDAGKNPYISIFLFSLVAHMDIGPSASQWDVSGGLRGRLLGKSFLPSRSQQACGGALSPPWPHLCFLVFRPGDTMLVLQERHINPVP